MSHGPWPELDLAAWSETRDTLHLWTQIVGKVRLNLTPWINHSWNGTLFVTSRGLTTSLIPHGDRLFQMDFDFIDHRLHVTTVEGERRTIVLAPKSVATFTGGHGRPHELDFRSRYIPVLPRAPGHSPSGGRAPLLRHHVRAPFCRRSPRRIAFCEFSLAFLVKATRCTSSGGASICR